MKKTSKSTSLALIEESLWFPHMKESVSIPSVDNLRPVYTHAVHVKNRDTTGPYRTVLKRLWSGKKSEMFRHEFGTNVCHKVVERLW